MKLKKSICLALSALIGLTAFSACRKDKEKSNIPTQSEVPALNFQKYEPEDKNSYQNDLTLEGQWENYGIGDPYIMKYNGRFYLYVSTPYGKQGIMVWSSDNAFDWKYETIVAADQNATFTAYSPKVIYWNGTFYLYTTPNGAGLHVLTASTPLGPFTDVTGRMHDSIDACIFIDDDGQWYLGHGHAGQGIEYHTMSSPTEIDIKPYYPGTVVAGNGGNLWTETGEIFKRDNTYYMTFSGNHVANHGYRTLWASSSEVLSGYEIGQRPLLASTFEDITGTACGLVFQGPDLINDYIVYHNLINPNVGPIRGLNIDLVSFNGAEMTAYGPTDFKQEKAKMPTSYDFLTTTNNFTNLTSVNDGFGELSANTISEYSYSAKENYVAEANYVANGGKAVIGFSSNAVKLEILANGNMNLTAGSISKSAFYTGYNADFLHKVKVDFRNNRLQVYIDGMRKFDEHFNSVGGKISYQFENGGKVGFTAVTQESEYSSISKQFPSYKGNFFAKDYAKDLSFSSLSLTDGLYQGKAVALKNGEYARYRVNAGDNSTFNAVITYRASGKGILGAVASDSKVYGGFEFDSTNGTYTQAVIKNISLGNYHDILTLCALEGAIDINSFRLYPIESVTESKVDSIGANGFTKMDGKWTAIGGKIKSYDNTANQEQANIVYGSDKWSDYTVEVQIALDKNSVGKAGLLLRVNNIAENSGAKHQIFAYNDQSYYVYIDHNGYVGLNKHNFNSEDIKKQKFTTSPFDVHTLKVVANGNKLSVYVDGELQIEYTDVNDPYVTGKVGLHSEACAATYSGFKVGPIA